MYVSKWNGENFNVFPVLGKELQQLMNQPLLEMSPLIGCPIQSGHPSNHRHANNKNRLSRLHLLVHTYVCICIYVAIIKEKRC